MLSMVIKLVGATDLTYWKFRQPECDVSVVLVLVVWVLY